MKKILLIAGVVFFALFSNKTNGQTIDTLIISQYIECPGLTASLDVIITQTIPSTSYNIALQKINNLGTQYLFVAELSNTTITNHTFTGLFSDLYRVILVDVSLAQSSYPTTIGNPTAGNPLVFSFAEKFIGSPANLLYTTSDDTLECWNETDAILTVNILNGYTPPYTISFDDGINPTQTILLPSNITSFDFTNLAAGSYNISVTDTFNCPPVVQTHPIISPDTIIPGIITIDSITCFDSDDGELTINPIGGTQPPALTIDWYDVATGLVVATGNSTGPILSPGQYYALITDNMGCDTISDTITLLNPLQLLATTTQVNPICNGDTGFITIIIDSILQGFGGPFSYTPNGIAPWPIFSPFPTIKTLPPLPAGVYSNIKVRDVNLCVYDLPAVTLIEPPLLEFSISGDSTYNGYGVSCNGVCNAEITIDSVWGGNLPPYGNSSSYFDNVIFVDTLIGSDTCAGTYSYLVTDSLGCEGNNLITINEPSVFSISADTVLLANGYSVSCPGTCDGLITITPNGGAGDTINYFVSSSNSFQSDISFVTFNNICGENTNNGQDTIIAIDANGCIDTANISLLEPVLFTYDIDSTNENCSLNNGTAWVSNINGGLSPYTYSWTDPLGTVLSTNNDTIENLSYGQYNVTVTDAMGCFFNDSTFVDSSFILVDYNVLVPCNGIDNGEIIINTNGVLLSQVVLEDLTNNTIIVNHNSSYDLFGNLVQNPNIAVIDTFSNLTSGSYELRVELYGNPQGSQGCTSVSYPITIGDSVSMDATLDYTLSELDLACFGDMTDSIFIDVTDGFNLTPNSPFDNTYSAYTIDPIGINTATISPGNHNFLLNTGGLPAGNYDIVVTPNIQDAFGAELFTNCYDTVEVSVIQPDSMQFTLNSVQTLCYGDNTGIIFVDTIFGGNSGDYDYTWKDASGGTISYDLIVTDLPAGWYFLTVLDSLRCTPATIDSVEITEPTDISWVTIITAIDSCEYTSSTGSIVLDSLSGGMGPYSYVWNGLAANGNSFTSTTQNLSTLTSGTYYVTITDTNSCTKNDTVFIDNGQNPSVDSSSFTNVSCFGLHDGSYIAIVDTANNNGSLPYTFYDFSSISFVSGYIPSADSLGPGDTINIRLKDNFGCVDSSFYIITEPDLLQITSLLADTFIGGYNVSCNGILDGAITFDIVVGGTPNYTYWLQDTNSVQNPLSINPLFDTLAATYYKAFVIDANGCLDSLVITLTQPDSLLIDSFDIHTYIGGNNVSCDGFSDGAAQVYASGGNQIYSYTWSSAVADSLSLTDTVIDLSAISYTLVVTDPNGCNAIGSINLTEPTPLLINGFNTTNLLCKGGDRGNTTANVSGAIAGYTYLWDNANSTIPTYVNPNDTVPSMNDTTAFADTLRVGWYNVEVWDMNGCYITDSVELTEPIISITIDSLIVSQMTCFSYNNASIDVIATGPQPIPYLYSAYEVSNPLNIYQGNLGITSGLSSGNYVALVEDNIGCLDRDTFIINPLDAVYIDTVVFNNVSCNGFNDGYIQNIVPMGGTAPYEYSINGGPHFSSWLCTANPNTCPTGYQFSGLAAGIYDVEIWDANGCANSYKITINEPVQMAVSITTNSYNNYQILCNGDTDSAVVNVSGGLSPYTLDYGSISLTNNSGSFNPSGILAGVYTFTISDDNSCTYIETVTFNDPNPITFTSIITDVFCQDSCTGEITVIVAGGVGLGNGSNYLYQWYEDPGATIPMQDENSYNIDSLCTGDYTIIATDANGCTGLLTPTIGGNVLQIANTTINDVSCYEICDGLIDINVSGGVPASSGAAYTYEWNDVLFQTANPAIGLCAVNSNPLSAGSYTCTVTDMAGCIVTNSIPFIVTQPNEFDANIILSSPIECNGGTGDLSITTTGGINPIASYEWSDGTTTNSLNSVIAGNYTCFVEDNNGCTDTAHYNLLEPSVLTVLGSDIVKSDVKCKGGSTGEIQIMGSGGTPIPGIPGKYNYELFDINNILVATINNQLVAEFIGLITGIYFIKVTDNNNCSYTTSNLFIGQPDNDLEITIDYYDETCLLNDAYAVVYPTGGTPGYSFDWDNNGASSNSQQILLAGENTPHTVIVTDDNGCEVSETITLLGYKNVFLPNNNDYYNASICLGETINIDIDDKLGLTYVWTMSNGAVVATTADLTLTTDSSFSPIEILTLTITAPDCGGSHSVMATVNIDDLDPQCSADKLTILLDQSVTLSEIGAVNFGTYEWTTTNGEFLSNSSSFTYQPEKSAWYNLFVTNGVCKGYCSIYITLGVLPVDAISPNGDGYNDTWYIQDLDRYPDAIVKVFNRWGQLLLESDGPSYPNNDFNWTELPVGTYYYIIDLGNGDSPQTGPITIIK